LDGSTAVARAALSAAKSASDEDGDGQRAVA
jgi:hypothetical protein